MTGSADIIYIVHGSNAHTWWRRLANRGYPWWRRWSLFCCNLRRTFAQECEIREFQWSGHNTHQARIAAGSDLARTIEKDDLGRKIHVIGHSHGGNVALVAVNQLQPFRVDSVFLLANPNMTLHDSRESPSEWLYWGKAVERVQRLWNLYSPQDIVQCELVRFFHGIPNAKRKTLRVRPIYEGAMHQSVHNGEIRWNGKRPAHRALHSGAMGAVVGSLLRDKPYAEALNDAGLSVTDSNPVKDRGGWPGIERTEEWIRRLGDPSPFDLGNSADIGILFVHGFTASPSEMRAMAQLLAQAKGWRCKGILLPGHGTRVEALQGTSGEDWLANAERAYTELAQQCRHVFLAGLSLGAVLCCHVAHGRPNDPRMRGLILMAPAFGVTRLRTAIVRLLKPVKTLRSKPKRASDYFLDNKLYSYVQTPLNRASEVLKLGRQAVENMSKLRHIPTMMFVGDRESTVSLKTMLSVAEGNPWIQLVRLPRSRHILTVEPDREKLFEASARFVEECLRKQRI
jgi:carboxylesterase